MFSSIIVYKMTDLILKILIKIFSKFSRLQKKVYEHKNLLLLKRYGNSSVNSMIFDGNSEFFLSPESTVSFGENFICRGNSIIRVLGKGELIVGHNSGFSNVDIRCRKKIIIGNFVNIGEGTLIRDTNSHSTNWEIRADRIKDQQDVKDADVVIGDFSFIGARCMIMKGVTIGERSIIAAGSVVIKDIPSDCIAGGNPCKVIKSLL